MMIDLRAISLLGVLGLLACGGGSSGEYDLVATGVSSLMADPEAGEPRTFADLVIASRGEAPIGLTLTNGSWVGFRDQLELKFNVTCTNPAGCDGAADVKVEWKGTVDKEKYKLQIERKGDWKTTPAGTDQVRIQGMVTLKLKSDFKDPEDDIRHKYEFDSTSKYDVIVQKADGAIVSGTADHDLHAKEKAEDGSESIKSELKVKMDVVFTDGEADLSFASKSKYRLKLDSGDLDQID